MKLSVRQATSHIRLIEGCLIEFDLYNDYEPLLDALMVTDPVPSVWDFFAVRRLFDGVVFYIVTDGTRTKLATQTEIVRLSPGTLVAFSKGFRSVPKLTREVFDSL